MSALCWIRTPSTRPGLAHNRCRVPLTDICVEENAETTWVHRAKLAQVIDDRVDDDPQVAFLVVLLC